MLVFIKAVIPAHGQSDLFPQTVQVKGHVRGTRFVLPHRSTRRKHIEEAPHQPEPPKPVVVLASKPKSDKTDTQAEEKKMDKVNWDFRNEADGSIRRIYISTLDAQTADDAKALIGRFTSRPITTLANEVAVSLKRRDAELLVEALNKRRWPNSKPAAAATPVATPAAAPQQDRPSDHRVMIRAGASPRKEVVVRGERHVLAFVGRPVRITEDDPSIWGEHLLGHEGEMAQIAHYRRA